MFQRNLEWLYRQSVFSVIFIVLEAVCSCTFCLLRWYFILLRSLMGLKTRHLQFYHFSFSYFYLFFVFCIIHLHPIHFPIPSYLPSVLAISPQNKIKFKRKNREVKEITLVMEAVVWHSESRSKLFYPSIFTCRCSLQRVCWSESRPRCLLHYWCWALTDG